MSTDDELLRRFVDRQADDAFAALVHRHIGLVHATALRRVGGDAHLAHDVTQTVFLTLARKAPALLGHATLAGWLFVCTQHAAAETVRGEQRRKQREAAAQSMQNVDSLPDPVAEPDRLRPLLDDAIITLKPAEREAVVLRFFEQRTFAEVGAALRITEEAARKRVDRALGKMQAVLVRRGLTSTVAALGVALTAAGAGPVPATLAAQVASTAVAQAAAAGAGTSAVTTVLSSWLPATAAAALILAGSGVLVSQHRANQALASAIAELERADEWAPTRSDASPRPAVDPVSAAPQTVAVPVAPPVRVSSPAGASSVSRAAGKSVVVTTEGALVWEGERVTLDTFLVQLAAHQKATAGESKLIVQANGARFRQMCYVLDEARKAGIKHVLVETDAAPDSYYPLTWF